MISGALSSRAQELRARGEAFVTATVVRAQAPTSAQPGSVALIHVDGTIEGFVGGVCAEQSVRLYSLKAIDSGEPLLLRIRPDVVVESAGADSIGDSAGAESPGDVEDGAVTVHNPCLSGGALEIFLEPALPPPRVTVAGQSLIAAALRSLAPELGLDVGEGGPARGDIALVVAAHGRDELTALRAGLEAGIPYVGLVASRVRGAAVLDDLRTAGLAEDLLGRVETPAGLDIGARTPAEIALSILARIVAIRRAGGWRTDAREAGGAGTPAAQAAPLTAVDPICGMTVVVGPDTPSTERDGELVYFCCEGCKLKFEAGDR